MSRCLLETEIDQAWWMAKWHEKDFKDKDQGHPTTVNNHENGTDWSQKTALTPWSNHVATRKLNNSETAN